MRKRQQQMDSSFRWNDGKVVHRNRRALTLRAWIPAFAGMTVKDGLEPEPSWPDAAGLDPGLRPG
jgi:hypothetical protein